MKWLLVVVILMSVFTFVLFGIDKWRASHHRWRISEAALLAASLCFGGSGGLLGMLVFHHKTQKWIFRILVPLFTAAQVAALIWLYQHHYLN